MHLCHVLAADDLNDVAFVIRGMEAGPAASLSITVQRGTACEGVLKNKQKEYTLMRMCTVGQKMCCVRFTKCRIHSTRCTRGLGWCHGWNDQVGLNGSNNSPGDASTLLLSDHLLLPPSLNMWASGLCAFSLPKPTHRHRQLLPRLRSSQVTWSNAPGSTPHSPGIRRPLPSVDSPLCSNRRIFCLCVRPKNDGLAKHQNKEEKKTTCKPRTVQVEH